jgi:hypothetical protein
MLSTKQVCEMAEAFGNVSVKDHFGSDAYSANGRNFATVWHDRKEVNLRLTPELQRHYLSMDGDGFAEIDNAWGRQGWTKVQLEYVDRRIFAEALKAAWECSAVKSKTKTQRGKK